MSGARERCILVSGRETMMDVLEDGLRAGGWRTAEVRVIGGHGERPWYIPMVDIQLVDDLVPAYKLNATKAVLAERERELLELKGPCSTDTRPLHHAHAGPCDPQ